MFKIDIVGTGSDGNCIIIDDDLVIDLGVKKKEFIEHFDGEVGSQKEQKERLIQLLDDKSAYLITHRHGDHIQVPILNVLDKDKPWALLRKLYANESVANHIPKKSKQLAKFKLGDGHLLKPDIEFEIAGKQTYHIKTFKLEHDVENQGFIITNEAGETLVYATDTSTMKHCPRSSDGYDVIMLEGNYDEDKIDTDLVSEDPAVADRALRNLRHLSVQAFEDFVRKNSKSSTIVYQLHESVEYGLASDFVSPDELKN